MANELTRKGIAFGAAVALGSTLVVGGAANAAPNVNYQDLELTAAQGSEDNGIMATTSEDNFGLVLSWNGDVNTQNLDDLKYDFSWADADTEDGTGYGWFGSTSASYDTYDDRVEANYYEDGCWTEYAGWEAPHAGGSFTDTEDEGGIGYTGPVPAWDATSDFGYDNDGALTYWGAPFIQFGTCYTPDYKAVVTVQAYIDTNGNDVIDNTETHSAAVDVTFYNSYNLTPVLALENDGVVFSSEDSGYVGYELTFAEKFNSYWTEDANDSDSGFYGNYSVVTIQDNDWDDEDYSYAYWSNEESDVDTGTLGDGDSVEWDNYDEVEDNGSRVDVAVYNYDLEDWVTEPQQLTFMDPNIDYVIGEVVEQDYVIADDYWDNEEDSIYSDSEWVLARDDQDSFEYVLTFYDNEDNPVANADVVAYLNDYSEYYDEDYYDLDAEDTAALYNEDYGLTVNGEAFDADEYAYVVEGTTNADGELVLDVAVENPDTDLFLSLGTLETQDNGAVIGADMYWEEADFEIEFASGLEDEDTYTGVLGGEFTVDLYVADQWGQFAPAGSRVWVYDYYDDSEDFGYAYTELKNGMASVTVTDGTGYADEDGEDDYYEVGLEVKLASGYSEDYSGDDAFYVEWFETKAAVDYLTSDWSDNGIAAPTYGDFINDNSYFAGFDWDAYDRFWSFDSEYIYGTVHGANGLEIGGAEVTISGSGLGFFDDYGYEYASNSITVRADDNGDYGVYVLGHEVGEYTVTVTSNGKSTTETLVIDDSSLYASAVSVSPFTGKAGTSENITATVTDMWGNLVPDADVTFSVTGGGYFVDDVATTGGDADDAIEDVAEAGYGQASEMLVILSNEVGYGSTVTATIDVIDPFGEEEDTTASASLAAGATDFGKPAFWTKDLGDGTLKLYAKNIVGAGKIQFFHNGKEIAWIKAVDALDPKLRAANGSYYLVRTVKLVSGKNVLEIKDDGVRVVRRVASK